MENLSVVKEPQNAERFDLEQHLSLKAILEAWKYKSSKWKNAFSHLVSFC